MWAKVQSPINYLRILVYELKYTDVDSIIFVELYTLIVHNMMTFPPRTTVYYYRFD